jgi:hypothetical protein
MDTYVKRGRKLIHIGEGRVFRKGDLMLREDDTSQTGITAVANQDGSDFSSSSDAVNKIKQTIQKPGVSNVQVPKNDLPIAAHKVEDPTLGDTSTRIELNKLTPGTLDKLASDGQGNVEVVKSSVDSRKVMDEMRRNSIPFTKSELTDFLRSI